MTEKHWYLKNCQLFERLSAAELERIESVSRSREYPRASPIYLPADESDSVFLLATGRAKICQLTPDGKQSILAFIEPGELFGELALLGQGHRDEYAETVERSRVILIPADVLRELLEQKPELSIGVTKIIGFRRKRVERRLKNLLFLSNRERLIHLLLELSEKYADREGSVVSLTIKLSHQDLANVIGSTRETVTVLLGELQADGLLRLGRRKIMDLQLPRLAAAVQQPAAEMRSCPS